MTDEYEPLAVTELLAPISDDDPAGRPMDLIIREVLDKARRDDPEGERGEPQRADWGAARRTAERFLAQTGKDLSVAVRLLEAVTHTGGFAGLADGLTLLCEMCEQGWDRMHPETPVPGDEDSYGARVGRFNWVNDRDGSAGFPMSVRDIPVLRVGGSGGEDETACANDRVSNKELFEGVARRAKASDVAAQIEHAKAAAAALDRLDAILSRPDRLGDFAPDWKSGDRTLGKAIGLCLAALAEAKKLAIPDAGAAPAPAAGDAADESPSAGGGGFTLPTNVGASRDAVYAQLGVLADALEKLEPHSPVPHLVRRAVKLGGMSFVALIHDLSKNDAVTQQLRELLAVEE